MSNGKSFKVFTERRLGPEEGRIRDYPTWVQASIRYRKQARTRIIASPETYLQREIFPRQNPFADATSASVFFYFYKGSKMNSNQKSGQGNKQSGTQGGSHEQHVEAGRQSHKNDSNKQSSGSSSNKQSSTGGTRGGTPEQHAEAGRQSHKNDR
jgi:hypothetical protein